MLEKIGKGIIKYKGVILLTLAIIFAITVVGTVFLVLNKNKINSDMVSYLSEDSKTKQGLVFLQDEFDIRGNATLVVRVDENDESDLDRFHTAVNNVKNMERVTNVTWYGSVASYEQFDDSIHEVLEILYDNKENIEKITSEIKGISDVDKLKALITLSEYYDKDFIDTKSMEDYLKHPVDGYENVYDYVIIILTDIDSGDSSYALLDSITAEFEYTQYAFSGTTETARRLLYDTMADLPWFIVAGVLSVLVILLLCSSSYVEPFILISTLAVGIVISMGMNYLFPSISIISFAISAVLQLAITMDYAIFYMHIFRKNRAKYDVDVATYKAFPEVAESVLASGFTTVGGFVALYCMQFKIGTDIANVLVKGVIMSMLTVLLLQPILTLLADGVITKTTHHFTEKITSLINGKRVEKGKKEVTFEKNKIFRPVARFAVWQRIVLIVIAVGLIVPCFLAQRSVKYSYLELYEKNMKTEEDLLANELGNQLILAVPVEPLGTRTQREFINEIKSVNDKRITGMLGVFTAIDIKEKNLIALLNFASTDMSSLNSLEKVLREEPDDEKAYENLSFLGITEEDIPVLRQLLTALTKFSKNVDLDSLKNSYFRQVDGIWYTLYTISFSGNTEDDEAQEAYEKITELCDEYFGKVDYYPVGLITSSNEMSSITPHDFLIVTIVSVAIIYLIVTLLLRNPLKSLFIVVIIELGIWINLAFNYLFNESINFIVYVIISSVQLGCTVDYAILYANTFEKKRNSYTSGKECAKATTAETIPAIITSALMIGSVCISMYLISGNIIIKQLTSMLARGALISLILVAFVQTAVWSFFKTERKQYNFEAKLKALENEENSEKTETPENEEAKNRKPKKKKLSPQEKLALLEQEEKNN